MKHFLLDTNIIIDLLTDRKPFSLAASQIFELGEKQKVKLYISALSYSNIYYIVRKTRAHKDAINTLETIEDITVTIDCTKGIIQQALASEFRDFEDAIQYHSALSINKIEGIITRNSSDFKWSKLPILSPHQAVSIIRSSSK